MSPLMDLDFSITTNSDWLALLALMVSFIAFLVNLIAHSYFVKVSHNPSYKLTDALNNKLNKPNVSFGDFDGHIGSSAEHLSETGRVRHFKLADSIDG